MKLSSDIPFLSVDDESGLFKRVRFDASEIVNYADGALTPEKENVYIADDGKLRSFDFVKRVETEIFAELPVQAGWCFGGGKSMNGMEWHKSSEVVAACSDCVLILGSVSDVRDGRFCSADSTALYLKRGEAAELYGGTLHLAPLAPGEYFKAAIILPYGTNSPLKNGIDGERRAVNKWLLVHPQNERGIALGGKIGIEGDNIRVTD